MNKQEAIKLIKNTFESPFDKGKYFYFLKNLLNQFEEKPFKYWGSYITEPFRPYIKKFERIGKYYDKNDTVIELLVVYLRKETSLIKARTMQRNFIARYLKGQRGGIFRDAALVAFVSPEYDNWRFSLVKIDYKFDDNGKVIEEKSPAKRWSFLVGKFEKSHTAQSRLLPILIDDKNNL